MHRTPVSNDKKQGRHSLVSGNSCMQWGTSWHRARFESCQRGKCFCQPPLDIINALGGYCPVKRQESGFFKWELYKRYLSEDRLSWGDLGNNFPKLEQEVIYFTSSYNYKESSIVSFQPKTDRPSRSRSKKPLKNQTNCRWII